MQEKAIYPKHVIVFTFYFRPQGGTHGIAPPVLAAPLFAAIMCAPAPDDAAMHCNKQRQPDRQAHPSDAGGSAAAPAQGSAPGAGMERGEQAASGAGTQAVLAAVAGTHPAQGAAAGATRDHMRALYDAYFASPDYESRYPAPNTGTMAFLRRHGAMGCRQVLDFGCGNGRYAIPFLEASQAALTGCDISAEAIQSFGRRLARSDLAARVELVTGGLEAIPDGRRFDAQLLLFGVLSHVGRKAQRVALLRQLRALAAPDCKLFLSVPSIWRRRPLELLRSIFDPARETFGDIHFGRHIAGARRSFFYHLYTPARLRRELAEAGWTLVTCEAESILPEYLVTASALTDRLDRLAQPVVPAALGYGIRALARPAQR